MKRQIKANDTGRLQGAYSRTRLNVRLSDKRFSLSLRGRFGEIMLSD